MKLQIEKQGDREIVITRAFRAPKEKVFAAYTTPALLQQWLGVWGDWTMPVCEVDLRVGGAYRWEWFKAKTGYRMGVSGIYKEVAPPDQLVCTELFDDAWYPGESLVTVAFIEADGITTLRMTMRYETAEARDGVFDSPMASGVERSFEALEALLSSGR